MIEKINFRRYARRCHKQASAYLDDAQYVPEIAALYLRMALENLAYELLQNLEEDSVKESMRTWQPGRLIKELKEIDPSVDEDRSIRLKSKDAADTTVFEGTEDRLTAKWVSKHYNALGSFLHARTLSEHRKYSGDDTRLNEIISDCAGEIERILNSRLWALNLKNHVNFDCDCGFVIRRRVEQVEKQWEVNCSNCNKIYGAEKVNDQYRFEQKSMSFRCIHCRREQLVTAYVFSEGDEITCCDCDKSMFVRRDWVLSKE